MAYNESLADRIREMLADLRKVSEKKMFGGIAFMVNDKMCICVTKDGLMCRTDPGRFDELTNKHGAQPMVMKGKEMSGYLLVDEDAVAGNRELRYWVDVCLDFNPKAQASKKKSSKRI